MGETSTASDFIGKLLDPLSEAELADPELAKLERRAARRRWEAGWLGVRAAACRGEAVLFGGCYARDYLGRPLDELEWRRLEDEARRDHIAQVDRQFLLPAPNAASVHWKRSVLAFGLKRSPHAPYDVIDARLAARIAALAADEVRLGLQMEKVG